MTEMEAFPWPSSEGRGTAACGAQEGWRHSPGKGNTITRRSEAALFLEASLFSTPSHQSIAASGVSSRAISTSESTPVNLSATHRWAHAMGSVPTPDPPSSASSGLATAGLHIRFTTTQQEARINNSYLYFIKPAFHQVPWSTNPERFQILASLTKLYKSGENLDSAPSSNQSRMENSAETTATSTQHQLQHLQSLSPRKEHPPPAPGTTQATLPHPILISF